MAVAKIPGGARRTLAILSRDRMEDDEKFCTALPIHLRVQSMSKLYIFFCTYQQVLKHHVSMLYSGNN